MRQSNGTICASVDLHPQDAGHCPQILDLGLLPKLVEKPFVVFVTFMQNDYIIYLCGYNEKTSIDIHLVDASVRLQSLETHIN